MMRLVKSVPARALLKQTRPWLARRNNLRGINGGRTVANDNNIRLPVVEFCGTSRPLQVVFELRRLATYETLLRTQHRQRRYCN